MFNKYTREEREEALKPAAETGAAAAARRLDIRPDTIYGWKRRAKTMPS